jgi:hypothetical protein
MKALQSLHVKASLLFACAALCLSFALTLGFTGGTASAHALFSCSDNDILCSNQTIPPGNYIISNNGTYKLIMETNGILELYSGRLGRVTWSRSGPAGSYAIMQNDGNFVLYTSSHAAVWASGTVGHPNDYIIIQNDGNVVIYDGQAIWSTKTAGQ